MMYWELYKAVKYQVEEYSSDHGYTVAELWKLIKTGGENAEFWKYECERDWKEYKAAQSEMRFWMVWTFDNSGEYSETVAVVADRQIAKSITRYYKRLGHKCNYFLEPTRWA